MGLAQPKAAPLPQGHAIFSRSKIWKESSSICGKSLRSYCLLTFHVEVKQAWPHQHSRDFLICIGVSLITFSLSILLSPHHSDTTSSISIWFLISFYCNESCADLSYLHWARWTLLLQCFQWEWGKQSYLDASENGGTPKSSHFNRVFHYFQHPFWVPLFLETSHFNHGGQTIQTTTQLIKPYSTFTGLRLYSALRWRWSWCTSNLSGEMGERWVGKSENISLRMYKTIVNNEINYVYTKR